MSLIVLPKGALCVEIWERSQRTDTYWSFLQTGLPPASDAGFLSELSDTLQTLRP